MECKITHQICHGFYCSHKKWLKVTLVTGFLDHSKTFSVYTLLCSKSYAPILQQNKDVMKIHNFITIKFVVVKLRMFNVICIDSASIKQSFLENVLGYFSLKYGDIQLKFLPEVVVNPFVPNASFFYHLKTSENFTVF